MSINPIGPFNPSSASGANFGSPVNGSHPGDPSKILDTIVNRLFSQSDPDGDGDVDAQVLSGLSKDAFAKLDTDGDGKVSKNELKSVIRNQRDALKDAFQNGGRQGVKDYVASIQNTPEGELLQLLAPGVLQRFSHSQTGIAPNQPPANPGTPSGLDVIA